MERTCEGDYGGDNFFLEIKIRRRAVVRNVVGCALENKDLTLRYLGNTCNTAKNGADSRSAT